MAGLKDWMPRDHYARSTVALRAMPAAHNATSALPQRDGTDPKAWKIVQPVVFFVFLLCIEFIPRGMLHPGLNPFLLTQAVLFLPLLFMFIIDPARKKYRMQGHPQQESAATSSTAPRTRLRDIGGRYAAPTATILESHPVSILTSFAL
jgi:hypothetical protein